MLKLNNAFLHFSDHRIQKSKQIPFPAHEFPVSTKPAITVRCCRNNSTVSSALKLQKLIGRIRERITNGKLEISPAAYDTAWVAMVPAREYSGEKPCFPECLDWIIRNQNPDGSWGLDPGHPSLVKDSLCCTLACLLALYKWNVGHQQLHKGLEFIRANTSAASDKDQLSPIGFNVIFPTMIAYANQLDLTLPFDKDLLDSMILSRDSQINKSEGNYMNFGYVAEGIGVSFDWNNMILTQQRNNGSLFNSPATTAAALVHRQGNNNCFEYLQSLLKTFKNCVPTVYPLEIYTRLCLVDTIQELGIDRHFESEINSILEETYRLWQLKDEEIFTDITCCVVAFRLLRIKGFEVSSDELAPYAEQDHVSSIQTTGGSTIFELYRASNIRIHEEENTLDAINDWTTTFLKQQLLSETIRDKKWQEKVEYELQNFHGILGRVGNRRSLDLYDVDKYQVMKAAYRCPTIYNEDLLVFSRQDFNISQALHQKEFQQILERWHEDCGFDRLNFGRDALHTAHFLASAIFGDPQLVNARISLAKNVVLIARIDDFLDRHGSRSEDSYKILELVKEWNIERPVEEYGSKEVEILFTALYKTVNELAEKAYVEQGRCVKRHLINLWVELLASFAKELDSWYKNAAIIKLDEYLSFAWISIGSGVCILTSIYFLGIKLSEEMISSEECISLSIHAGTIVRLLNDLRSCQKENEETRLNAVSIIQKEDEEKGEEMAISKIEKMVEYNRRKLMTMVYRRGTILPRKCKDLFSDLCRMGYYLYSSGGGDEFTSPQLIMEDMRLLIHQPLKLPLS